MTPSERRRAAETISAMAADLDDWATIDLADLKPGTHWKSIRLAAEGRAIAARLAEEKPPSTSGDLWRIASLSYDLSDCFGTIGLRHASSLATATVERVPVSRMAQIERLISQGWIPWRLTIRQVMGIDPLPDAPPEP